MNNTISEHTIKGGQQDKSGLTRRRFFKIFGGGLVVAFVLDDLFLAANGSTHGSYAGKVSSIVPDDQIGAWIHILEDGTVNVFTGKVEVGQNIRTSLSQAVAEELHVPIDSIKMIMGDTDLVPSDGGTIGSRSTPQMGSQLRKAAATARMTLMDMAAKSWNTQAEYLRADKGMVIDTKTNKKITYGELTKGQQLLLPISTNVQVSPAADWKIAGKSVPKVNGNSYVTGKHKFVSDMKLPGMLYGKVLRPPAYQAKLISADLSQVRAIPGVTVVQNGNFIGVAAQNTERAVKAIKAIQAKWESPAQPSRLDIFEYLLKNSNERKNTGSELEQALASAEMNLSNTYHINYIAHTPLEPRSALAQWTEGKLTVWTGTQRPFGVQQELSDAFSLPKEKVRVIVPDTGSGYGGKHSGEAAIEAARLAKETGKPVKILWTREEEFTWAYFRPGGVIEVSSGVKKDGTISAWKFYNYNSGPAAIDTQYNIAHQENVHIPSKTPLKQGSYRGLASTANVFARESHIGDLARLVKMDQLDFRLKNLKNDRLKAVTEAASKAFGWNTNVRQAGRGYGLAIGFDKGGYVAACAEVVVNGNKEVKVVRITQAFECGAIVNPAHLENQVMGSIVQGLGGALFEAVDFADGKILNPHLSAYRVPRFRDVPKIEIILVNRPDLPSAGAGEASIIGIAPAIRNAILDASGVGLKTLPLIPEGKLA
jgi:nicotinate dehydrogenase subunit B